MRCAVILSGEIQDDVSIREWLNKSDYLICADGGARHLRRLDILPSLLVGDMDSILPDDQSWLDANQVPVRRYPAAKDETDSELAIMTALDKLPGSPSQHELIIVGAFGSRPDHVLANQLMAARLARSGWRLILTDGRSTIYTLIGGQQLTLDLPVYQTCPLAVSAIPVSEQITGLTYQGLTYPLINFTMPLGSTRGVSNRIESSPVEVTLGSGILLIVITPEV